MPERALLALQGPKAVDALARLNPGVAALVFMSGGLFDLVGAACFVTRSGYTGEDGFEISVPAAQAEALAEALLAQPEVKPAGLGARDTLRLEAGLCLYGHDINETTSPVEAGLTWAMQKVRRPGGARAGGYPGAAAIEAQLGGAAPSKRVGLVGLERVPVREGTPIVDAHGRKLGRVTSGTLSPTVNEPIAMAYLAANHALPHHEVYAEVRGKRQPMRVSLMVFDVDPLVVVGVHGRHGCSPGREGDGLRAAGFNRGGSGAERTAWSSRASAGVFPSLRHTPRGAAARG